MKNPFLKVKNHLLVELDRIDIYSVIIDLESYLDCVNILCKYNFSLNCKYFDISSGDILLLVDNGNIINLKMYLKNELDYLKNEELLLTFNYCLDILTSMLDFYELNKNDDVLLKTCGNCLHLVGEECGLTGEEVYDHYVRDCFESKK